MDAQNHKGVSPVATPHIHDQKSCDSQQYMVGSFTFF